MTWSWSTTNAGHHQATRSKGETLGGRRDGELPVGNEAQERRNHFRWVETLVQAARALQDCVFMQFTLSLHTVLFVALWRRLTRIVAGAVVKRQEEGDHIEQTIRWLHWPGEL